MREENIIYGLYNLREERELARGSFGYILQDISDIKNRYMNLGFHLHEALRMKYYEDFGYENFYKFCEKNFKLEKTAVSRCMNVWLAFAEKQNDVRKMWVDKRYADYSYSQLCELLPLKDEQRAQIKPVMSVKDIREKKKEWKRIESKVESEKQDLVLLDLEKSLDIEEKCFDKTVKTNIKPEIVATSQQQEDEGWKDEYCRRAQPELPEMKNMDQREQWVLGYKSWPVWCQNDKTEEMFYRYDLPDGFSIVIKAYPEFIEWSGKEVERYELFLLKPGYKHFIDCKTNMTTIKEHLKKM